MISIQGRLTLLAAFLALAMLAPASAHAQNGRPAPAIPETQTVSPAAGNTASGTASGASHGQSTQPATTKGGRVIPPGKVTLAFNEVPVDDVIFKFIVDTTGKVVMPVNPSQLKVKKITLMNDEPVDRSAALDLLIGALRLNGVGVIVTDDVIILDIKENMKTQGFMPVLKAEDDVLHRTDVGTYVLKIFRLKEAPAENVGEKIENLPDQASLIIDANSNQILLYGDIATAQHVQSIINELDHNHVVVRTKTFRLAYADASAISDQILDLFEPSGAQGGQANTPRNNNRPRNQQPGRQPNQPQPAVASGGTPGPVAELKVSVNAKQNAVTVQAEPAIIDAIDVLIREQWDLPTAKETARVYVLEHTDCLKVRELLQNLLGQGGGSTSTSGGGRGAAGGGRGGNAGLQAGGGQGGGGGVAEVLGNIYRIEAYPDQNSLVVLSKTTEALDYLDSVIQRIDQPSSIGLPIVVELKHANAVSLAEELNVLLAEAGTGGGLTRPQTGLSGQDPSSSSSSSGSGSSGTDSGFGGNLGDRGNSSGTGGGSGGQIEFPWQRGQPRDDQSPETSLIGKVRIVPIVRQNALAIVAPVAQRQAVTEIIKYFDRPGRQVMISAIIVEIELNNEMALGLRLSSSPISSPLTDNSIAASANVSGTINNALGALFDTSVLDMNVDINALLQAINQKTNLRILQEPRVFTADNQEAIFFDGQEVPFITDSQTSNVAGGGLVQSFEYKKVGVLLDVRPRITVQKDVDVEINLELSNVVPGVTILGGAVLDRRQTTTQIIVKNGQTIVLSGIMKDTDSETTRGVPGLEDIPLIGELFKSRETTKKTSEIVAFITPIVVDNPSENDDNFNKEERASLLELVKPLKEQLKNAPKIRGKIAAPIISPETAIQEDEAVGEGDFTPSKPAAKPKPPADDGQPMDIPPPPPPPVDIDEPAKEPSRQ